MVIKDHDWHDLCLAAANIRAEIMRMEDQHEIRENTVLAIFTDILAQHIRKIVEEGAYELPHRLEVVPK